jgi:hypothetical protein
MRNIKATVTRNKRLPFFFFLDYFKEKYGADQIKLGHRPDKIEVFLETFLRGVFRNVFAKRFFSRGICQPYSLVRGLPPGAVSRIFFCLLFLTGCI